MAIKIKAKPEEKTKIEKLTFTVAEAAAILGVCERTLRKYTKEGLISARKFGRRVLYLKEEIYRYLNEKSDE